MERKRIVRLPEEAQSPARSEFSRLVDIDHDANRGLTNSCSAFVKAILGSPKSDKVLNMTHVADVGPFEIEGLDAATNSLKEIMTVVQSIHPELYRRLGNSGMRVVGNVSGSKSLSLHSWGLAIDIKVDNVKDVRFNDKALYGLTLIAPIFHRYGWYLGGAFRDKEVKKGSNVYWSNEDAMHFEVSREKLFEWQRAGVFGPPSKMRQEAIPPPASVVAAQSSSHDRRLTDFLCMGDQGTGVVLLQNALIARNYRLAPDGRFGKLTELALLDFQRKHGLIANGIVGPKTAFYLGLH